MSLIIRNGNIVTSSRTFIADILVSDGKIVSIGNSFTDLEAGETIDAGGKYILPGGIDVHVHLDLPTPAGPSSDNFRTGTIAALFGGTTTIMDFVTPNKNESLITGYKNRMTDTVGSITDFGLHMSITPWNENTAAEMEQCVKEYGITSFKVYMAYKGVIGIEQHELSLVMKKTSELKALLMVHCELGDIILRKQNEFIRIGDTLPIYHALSRPPEVEAESVRIVVETAKKTSCPVYIVHTSVKESLEYIEKAQKEGFPVFSETCPQYLLLDESLYDLPLPSSLAYVISPPLRNVINQKYLWDGLKNGMINVVSTDHCPFFLKDQKAKGLYDFTKIPNGAGGIEHRLALLYTYGVLYNNLTLNQFVDLTSTSPAKIFGIYPQKGEIAVGSDADLVIWNPDTENEISSETHHQNCDVNIFEGIRTKGSPEYVIRDGKIIVYDKKMINDPGFGKYLKRNI